MTVKILLKRQFSEDQANELKELISQIRSFATGQPGYISGETLQRIDKPGECLVVSKWKSRGDWERWFSLPERTAIQQKIDALLESPTVYEIFEYE